jgi:hypothetical protein
MVARQATWRVKKGTSRPLSAARVLECRPSAPIRSGGRKIDAVDPREKAEGHSSFGRGLEEKADQVGAVQEMVALAGAKTRKVQAGHAVARGAVDQLDRLGAERGGIQRVLQREGAQDAGTVGRDLQARADLADRVGLFQDGDRGAAQGQCAGDRQARNPCPDHRDGLADQHPRSFGLPNPRTLRTAAEHR